MPDTPELDQINRALKDHSNATKRCVKVLDDIKWIPLVVYSHMYCFCVFH